MNRRVGQQSMASLPRQSRGVRWSWVGGAAGVAAIAGLTLGLVGSTPPSVNPATAATAATPTLPTPTVEPSTPQRPTGANYPEARALTATDRNSFAQDWTLETLTSDGEPLHVYLTPPHGERIYAAAIDKHESPRIVVGTWDPASALVLGYREASDSAGPFEWFTVDLRTGIESPVDVPGSVEPARDVTWLGRDSDGTSYGVMETLGADDEFAYSVVSWDAAGFGDTREYDGWQFTRVQPGGDLAVVTGYTDRVTHAFANLRTGEVQNFNVDEGCGVFAWLSEAEIGVKCGESQQTRGETFRMAVASPGSLVPASGAVTPAEALELSGFAQPVGTPLVVTGTSSAVSGIEVLTTEGVRPLGVLELPLAAWSVEPRYVGGSVYTLTGPHLAPVYVDVATGQITDLRWTQSDFFEIGIEYYVVLGEF